MADLTARSMMRAVAGFGVVAALLAGASGLAAPKPAPKSGPAPAPAALAIALADFGAGAVDASGLRAIRCDAAEGQAGALDCRWEQRMGSGWQLQTSWLSQTNGVWKVLDVPLTLPSVDRGKLKPLPGSTAP